MLNLTGVDRVVIGDDYHMTKMNEKCKLNETSTYVDNFVYVNLRTPFCTFAFTSKKN